MFSPSVLKSLVSEISSSADITSLCQISFNAAAVEETGYLFGADMTRVAFILSDYCRYVSLWSIKLQAKFCKMLCIFVS